MQRKSASRVVDLRIDAVAKASAQAVRASPNEGATERFLSRFLDHLHCVDTSTQGTSDADMAKLRRRARRGKI